uniref:Peptidase metallopeptidase domain-containing protein n=1 Tax=Meloidogyne incognita TaxID=6306 RepID=A0A914MN26_MELIC
MTHQNNLLKENLNLKNKEEENNYLINDSVKSVAASKSPFLTRQINENILEIKEAEIEEEENVENSKRNKWINFKNLKIIKNKNKNNNFRMTDNNRRKVWNKRRMVGIGIITLLLLTCTFTILDSFLGNSDNEGEEGEGDEEISKEDAKNYLNQFGYIEEQEGRARDEEQGHRTADQMLEDFSLESLKSAISKFQEFAGLPSTGELDNRTRKKMKKPRCGMQDVEMVRGGRGGTGTTLMWRKKRLTYRLEHATNDLPTYLQRKSLKMAFDAWSEHIPLDFEENNGYGNVDIRVRFAKRNHGDPWSFDGRGGVLAHATFPTDGQLHFDDDEQWAFMDAAKIRSYRYTDMFWVSLHEIGHVLGLSHSKVETAVMAPFYKDPSELVDWRNNYKTPELTYDDIKAAKAVYGNRNTPRPIKKEEDSLDDMFPNSEGDNDRWRKETNTTILPLLNY